MPSEPSDHPFGAIEDTFRRSVSILDDAGVPFLVGGSLASWARGGPETRNDLDFMVKPDDAERALEALVEAGMKPERPPEDWLLKARDGDVLVDLIFRPRGFAITDEVIARGEETEMLAMRVRVLSLEDLLVSKLLVLDDHTLDYEPVLQISRAVRERVDWESVRDRTRDSPYARAFFTLAEGLGVIEPGAAPTGRARVRVVDG